MADKVFVDTNILLRSQWPELAQHSECAALIISYREKGAEMWISHIPTGGKQIHDANIVATMLVNDVGTLLTLNGEDMRRFDAQISIAAPQ